MMKDDLCATMVRELRALAREVAAYPSDVALWQVLPGIANPGGTLARRQAMQVLAVEHHAPGVRLQVPTDNLK